MSVYLNEICLFSGDTPFVYKLFCARFLMLVYVNCDSSKISYAINVCADPEIFF